MSGCAENICQLCFQIESRSRPITLPLPTSGSLNRLILGSPITTAPITATTESFINNGSILPALLLRSKNSNRIASPASPSTPAREPETSTEAIIKTAAAIYQSRRLVCRSTSAIAAGSGINISISPA